MSIASGFICFSELSQLSEGRNEIEFYGKKKNFFKGLFAPKNSYNFVD